MKNVIDEFGNVQKLNNGYGAQTLKHLKRKLHNFDEYLFILYLGNNGSVPSPIIRNYPHTKKVLLWHSSENKRNNINKIKKNFIHTFSNYYWNTKNTTSIPLGYFSEEENENVPMQERLFNISFIGCLNRNRIELASLISCTPRSVLSLGMILFKKTTLKLLNDFIKYKHNLDLFQFNSDFNSGIDNKLFSYYLRHSKIVLCPRGWCNTETFRLYEAMRDGCVVITERLPDRNYYENIPVIQVDNWNDGLRIARNLVKEDYEILDKMGRDNKNFYEKYLSPRATAQIIADKLNSIE